MIVDICAQRSFRWQPYSFFDLSVITYVCLWGFLMIFTRRIWRLYACSYLLVLWPKNSTRNSRTEKKHAKTRISSWYGHRPGPFFGPRFEPLFALFWKKFVLVEGGKNQLWIRVWMHVTARRMTSNSVDSEIVGCCAPPACGLLSSYR